jgi:hypothetical protein
VHDFVAHVDRRAESFQRALDNGDGALDTGTETAGIGEKDLHDRFLKGLTSEGGWPTAAREVKKTV